MAEDFARRLAVSAQGGRGLMAGLIGKYLVIWTGVTFGSMGDNSGIPEEKYAVRDNLEDVLRLLREKRACGAAAFVIGGAVPRDKLREAGRRLVKREGDTALQEIDAQIGELKDRRTQLLKQRLDR